MKGNLNGKPQVVGTITAKGEKVGIVKKKE
jgi:hypothetical protein